MFTLIQLLVAILTLVKYHEQPDFVVCGTLMLLQSALNATINLYIFCTYDFSGSHVLAAVPREFVMGLRRKHGGKLLFCLLEHSWIGQGVHSTLCVAYIIVTLLYIVQENEGVEFGICTIMYCALRSLAYLCKVYLNDSEGMFSYDDVFFTPSHRGLSRRRRRRVVPAKKPLAFVLNCELHHDVECGKCCCSICLEQMNQKRVQACFECNHLYHEGCIVKMQDVTSSAPKCPECRALYTCV